MFIDSKRLLKLQRSLLKECSSKHASVEQSHRALNSEPTWPQQRKDLYLVIPKIHHFTRPWSQDVVVCGACYLQRFLGL